MTALAVFQMPGSNALDTAAAVIAQMHDAGGYFRAGLTYPVVYDTTEFIQQSVDEVIQTLIEAILLVVSSSSCSCRPGAPRSFRWSRSPCR